MTDLEWMEFKAEVIGKLDLLISKIAPSSTGAHTQFGPAGQTPLEPNVAVKSYYYDMINKGGAESFALQIRQREPGWPESKPGSITYNCWSREKAGDAIADMIEEFKAAYPDLFVK